MSIDVLWDTMASQDAFHQCLVESEDMKQLSCDLATVHFQIQPDGAVADVRVEPGSLRHELPG